MTDTGAVLEVVRTFDATPAQVFEAWTTHSEFSAWIGVEGVVCDVPVFEPRIGGRYCLIMHLESGDSQTDGVFQVIEPVRKLVFTWGKLGVPETQTLVTVILRDLDGKTELTLRQEGLPDTEQRERHAWGWNSTLNKLAARFSR